MNEETLPVLICFSHLRWNFVYQRPQHLMSRYRGRVYFFEEPVYSEQDDWLHVNRPDPDKNVFVVTPNLSSLQTTSSTIESRLGVLLDRLLEVENIDSYIEWYYTPMALKFTRHLDPVITIYDCMDELSNFKFAPTELAQLERELFERADIVFTGGNHLYAAKEKMHPNIFPFPSSIDKQHFLKARKSLPQPEDQINIPQPRLGYYGVIDERLDIDLLDKVAQLRPDWQFVLVGPVVKIDFDSLPKHPNIHYLGGKKYDELPYYLSGWDIAMMPFALNDSTKFISPTKTPEYLCGGKYVISTSITDVVNDYAKHGLVSIIKDADEFVSTADSLLASKSSGYWLKSVDEKLATLSWDRTWSAMTALMALAMKKTMVDDEPALKH